MEETNGQKNIYRDTWDLYVKKRFPEIQAEQSCSNQKQPAWRVLNTKNAPFEWPGDEWGDREAVVRLLEESLFPYLDGNARTLCELGSGAGRYTLPVLERFRCASIFSFDVSQEFERMLKDRCKEFVETGRLRTFLLNEDPMLFIRTLSQADLLGKVDGIYSFDSMVHVDLHTLVVYWLGATKALKLGGVLAMSVADACSEKGLMKFLYDAPEGYAQMGSAGKHFMWLSRDIVENTLSKLGFEVEILKGNGRDLFFTAKLVDPGRGEAWTEKAGAIWFDL